MVAHEHMRGSRHEGGWLLWELTGDCTREGLTHGLGKRFSNVLHKPCNPWHLSTLTATMAVYMMLLAWVSCMVHGQDSDKAGVGNQVRPSKYDM